MKKNIWQSITITPVLIGASLLATSSAQASEDANLAQAGIDANTQIINQLESIR